MTEMAPESAPVASDPAVSPNPFADAPTPDVTDPAAPADAPTPESAPVPPETETTDAPSPAPISENEGSAEEPDTASEGNVLVQLADDGEGQAIVLGNFFVGLSPVQIPADMLPLFESAAVEQGRKVVVL